MLVAFVITTLFSDAGTRPASKISLKCVFSTKGNVILSSEVQRQNAESPMRDTLSGIVIENKPVQPANAARPILVTLSGIVIEVKPVQSLNASSPMPVTGSPPWVAGIMMSLSGLSIPMTEYPEFSLRYSKPFEYPESSVVFSIVPFVVSSIVSAVVSSALVSSVPSGPHETSASVSNATSKRVNVVRMRLFMACLWYNQISPAQDSITRFPFTNLFLVR